MADLSLFEVTGFSMHPFLKAGERLLIKKIPVKDLKAGDIIIYRSDSQMVCHRLIKKARKREGYLLYARGDSSLSWSGSESIAEEMFLGKAISIIRDGRLVSLNHIIRQFSNRIIVVIGPLASRGGRIIGWCYNKLNRIKGLRR